MLYTLLIVSLVGVCGFLAGRRADARATKRDLTTSEPEALLEAGIVEDEEDDDDLDVRDLWDRLEDAGFRVIDIDEVRDWRLADVGAIKIIEPADTLEACKCGEEMSVLGEIHRYACGRTVDTALLHELGIVCEGCGYILITKTDPAGKLAPHINPNINFFDLLDYFERINGGRAKSATEEANLPFLERRRDQLEGELNEVRLAIKTKQTENGQSEPYRDSGKEPSESDSKEDNRPFIRDGIFRDTP